MTLYLCYCPSFWGGLHYLQRLTWLVESLHLSFHVGLKCQPSPPPNPQGARVRGRRRLTFQTASMYLVQNTNWEVELEIWKWWVTFWGERINGVPGENFLWARTRLDAHHIDDRLEIGLQDSKRSQLLKHVLSNKRQQVGVEIPEMKPFKSKQIAHTIIFLVSPWRKRCERQPFLSVDQNLRWDHSDKSLVQSSTFLWCCLLCCARWF